MTDRTIKTRTKLPGNSFWRVSFVAAFFALTLFAESSQAVVITELVPGIGAFDNQIHGQSVTTPTGGPWNNIQFNFYDETQNPVADGTLFVLTSEYLGAPQDLSALTPGFVGESTGIVGGVWQFNPTVSLASDTRYWFYTDAAINMNQGDSGLPAEVNYFSPNTSSNYFASGKGGDFSFRLESLATASVPEPSTLVLAALGLLGLGCVALRKKYRRG